MLCSGVHKVNINSGEFTDESRTFMTEKGREKEIALPSVVRVSLWHLNKDLKESKHTVMQLSEQQVF